MYSVEYIDDVQGNNRTVTRRDHKRDNRTQRLLSTDRSELMREVFKLGLKEVKLRYGIQQYTEGRNSIGDWRSS